jgi:hypothetical protein
MSVLATAGSTELPAWIVVLVFGCGIAGAALARHHGKTAAGRERERLEAGGEPRETHSAMTLLFRGLERVSAAIFALGIFVLIAFAVIACLEAGVLLGVIVGVAALGVGCAAAYVWSRGRRLDRRL